ncbi:facilitated trehalose transporter Tret1-like isoform X5 [Adelges cooleyi]|uniref:facilitated trehalose transporter Tret1-like isoform X4 n=1 Tax=Adelges cooleyi TaxID=133065 RepID=UPI00217F9367|nr:facilitated trehalose transporter Tret1-like isoform X4 [Adelges cooleyi]XP_050430114.1 facilitated trehalose transporter Tret1-like isoform X5 [Adelges cooleyi]
MKNEKLHLYINLILSNGLMNIHEFVVGSAIMFSSILLPQLLDPSSAIHITSEEESWIASVPNLVCPIGLIITGILADKIGRKKSLQITYIPLFLGWGLLAVAQSANAILIARAILGYSIGTGIVIFLYAAETVPAINRPLFLSMITVSAGASMMLVSVLSIFYNWRTLAIGYCVLSAIGGLSLYLIPDPPIWLRSVGRHEEAVRAEQWFGMPEVSVTAVAPVSEKLPNKAKYAVFISRSVWIPTVHSIILVVCQQFSGIYIMFNYSVNTLLSCGVQYDALIVTAALFGARIVGSLAYSSLYLVKRRTLITVSSLGMFSSLATVVGYLHAYQDVSNPPYGYVMVVAFLIYAFASMLAMTPIPWSIQSEIFPTSVKGIMSGVNHSCAFFLMFVILKIYPSMVIHLGIQTVLSLYAGVCLITAMYGAFLFPETQGKSLDEILAHFDPKLKNNVSNIDSGNTL